MGRPTGAISGRRRNESTKQYLVRYLEKSAGASPWLVDKAEEGIYDEVESTLPDPLVQLVDDLLRDMFSPHSEVIAKVRAGEFDATPEEWVAWGQSPEGKLVKEELLKGLS